MTCHELRSKLSQRAITLFPIIKLGSDEPTMANIHRLLTEGFDGMTSFFDRRQKRFDDIKKENKKNTQRLAGL